MAVPKRKVSKSRRDKRSTGKALKGKNVIIDKSGKPKLDHVDRDYVRSQRMQRREEKKKNNTEDGAK